MSNLCRQCGDVFAVSGEDLRFLEMLTPSIGGQRYPIPPPTLCPPCRERRRMVWVSERTIYQRSCDLCQRRTMSMYSPDSPLTVYCQECFWSDRWDPLDSGREVDLSRPFFPQFAELLRSTPVIAVINVGTENSEHCHRIFDGRNNYLSFIALDAPEDLY